MVGHNRSTQFVAIVLNSLLYLQDDAVSNGMLDAHAVDVALPAIDRIGGCQR